MSPNNEAKLRNEALHNTNTDSPVTKITEDASYITITDLQKSYGSKTAVSIPALSIQPHTFTCIVGKSGGGKTTLLRLLAGLEAPDHENSMQNRTTHSKLSTGRTGEPRPTSESISGLPAKTAPVFQEPRLMPWLTVKENIMFSLKGQEAQTEKKNAGASDAIQANAMKIGTYNSNVFYAPGTAAHNQKALSPEERCQQLLQELDLTEAANLYPQQLSGGMAQRVSLGRTLFYDPDFILMDEPFSALDYFTRRNLQDMVLRLFRKQKKTILFVTHDVEEALLLG
ncbi:MAG: ATP-binding cassette domain-containing protein, partial [Acidaminococcaceae bacterium]|nr:ATP-binding cassette domain-containing protein [Acidaminococcaceae bacterium]